jgi:hypothetical protein
LPSIKPEEFDLWARSSAVSCQALACGTVILKELGRLRGTTSLVVTHDQRVLDYVDRVVTLDGGRLIEDLRVPSDHMHYGVTFRNVTMTVDGRIVEPTLRHAPFVDRPIWAERCAAPARVPSLLRHV